MVDAIDVTGDDELAASPKAATLAGVVDQLAPRMRELQSAQRLRAAR